MDEVCYKFMRNALYAVYAEYGYDLLGENAMNDKRKGNKTLRILIMIFICILVSACGSLPAEAAQETSKHIHIVLDNSVSMVLDGNQDLANATYALQVLLAMLNKEDTASIYPVSQYEVKWRDEKIDFGSCKQNPKCVHVPGSLSEERIREKVVDSVGDKYGELTFFSTVMNALGELKNEETMGEKWLVVLTDGEYEDWGWGNDGKEIEPSDVNKRLSNEIYNDINIVHYSFSKSIYNDTLRTKNEEHNINNITYYPDVTQAGEDNEMLDVMIHVGNQIFAREALETVQTGNTYSFSLEAPAKSLIVFAQREATNDASSDSIEIKPNFTVGDDRETKVETISDLKIHGTDKREYKVGTKAQGNLVVYDNFRNKGLLEAGDYSVMVEGGAQFLEVYYEPEIGIRLVLEQQAEDGNVYTAPGEEDTVQFFDGEYRISVELYDPISGDALEQNGKLASGTDYELSIVRTDGAEGKITAAEKSWTGELEKGTYSIAATADIFTGLSKTVETRVEVLDSLKGISAELVAPEGGINMEQLGEEENTLMIKMYNHGELLQEDYMECAELKELDMEASYYSFREERIEGGWRLWPELNTRNRGTDDNPVGWKNAKFEIGLKVGELERAPIELEEQIYYHGSPFTVNFQTNWGEEIGLWDYFRPLYIEPLVNGENVNWNVVEVLDSSPSEIKDEQHDFIISAADNQRRWRVIPRASFWNLLTDKEQRESTQMVDIYMSMARYEQEGQGDKSIIIQMDISLEGLVCIIIVVSVLIYILVVQILNFLRRVHYRGLRVTVEFQKEPLISFSGKITKFSLYNFFVPGKARIKVYLNEIVGAEGKKIVFGCRAGGVCAIKNFRECQSVSRMRINDLPVSENSMYDTDKEIRIVFERDPDKTIIVHRNK